MRLFYTIGIYLYTLGIRVAALFGHEKARLMVRGWRNSMVPPTEAGSSTAWFHAASLGEFEQARPVLEAFRERHPDYKVLVTFFSPSGYEVRKNYPLADNVIYLPMDTPRNARKLIDTYKPSIAFFVKYEFWFNYLGELKRRNIPTYIFSTIFRPGQYFFKWYGGWFRKQLKSCFAHLFVQNEESLALLKGIGIERCSLAGDTRFDRVHQIAVAAERNEVVEAFLDGHDGKVLVGGSTWPPDETLIKECVNALNSQINTLKIIMAPHVISEEHLKQIETLFPDSVRYSQIENGKLGAAKDEQKTNAFAFSKPSCVDGVKIENSADASNTQAIKVLIIDNIGLLSKLYRYADVAYIGGGFGVGIHNILEAVTFGKPVLFGPNYQKFQEARDIIALGGGWSHRDATELTTHLTPLLSDPTAYDKASHACTDYMNQNLGSTEKILRTIEK